jgi:hypothetical protein
VNPTFLAGLRALAAPSGELPAIHLAEIGPGEVLVVAIVFSLGGGIVIPLVRAAARRIERRGETLRESEVAARLERIEHAVEAIALEVERISEGQRFVTQLMSNREKSRAIGSGSD